MPFRVTVLRAVEILDSRARPTLTVTVGLAGGAVGHASVPSGASTGSHEAVELRDHHPARFLGLGVRTVVGHVNGQIADALRGRDFTDQATFDQTLIDLDGTPGKSRPGANALIGVSMPAARAVAARWGRPLWEYLTPDGVTPVLPVPYLNVLNVLNGGVHAPNPLDFQEFRVVPFGAPSMAEAVRAGAEVYGFLQRRLADAGYTPGRQGVALALDVAGDAVCRPDGRYLVGGARLTTEELIARYRQIAEDFPVCGIEDGLAEDDRVGCGCGQVKAGAPARGERVAKYNRLVQIAAHHPGLDHGLAR